MALAPVVSSNPLALIDSLGGGELLAILVLLMVVVGPDRLPDMARKIGRGIAQARRQITAMSSEVRDVVDDPAMQPLREIGEFAMRPRQKLSEIVKLAELDLTEETAAKQAKADRDAAAESGEPPRDDPSHPPNIDDKSGDRPPRPEDVHVAATRQAREAQAAANESTSEHGNGPTGPADDAAARPNDPAFTTRGAPLGTPGNGAASPAQPETAPPADPPANGAVRPGAFTAAGRPLGTPDQADTSS